MHTSDFKLSRSVALGVSIITTLMIAGCSSEPDRNAAATLLNELEWPAEFANVKYTAVSAQDRPRGDEVTLQGFMDELTAQGFLNRSEHRHQATIASPSSGRIVYGCDPATAYPGRLRCNDHSYVRWDPTPKLSAHLEDDPARLQGGWLRLKVCEARLGQVNELVKISDHAYRVQFMQSWQLTAIGQVYARHAFVNCMQSNDNTRSAILERTDRGWRARKL